MYAVMCLEGAIWCYSIVDKKQSGAIYTSDSRKYPLWFLLSELLTLK